MIHVAHHQRVNAVVERQHQRRNHRHKAERNDFRRESQIRLQRIRESFHPHQRHDHRDDVADDDERQRDEDGSVHRIERDDGNQCVGDARGKEDRVFEFHVFNHHHEAQLIGKHLNRCEQANRCQLKRMETDRADDADDRISDKLQQKNAQELIEYIGFALPLIIGIRLIQSEIRRHRDDGKHGRNAPQLSLEFRSQKAVGVKRRNQTDEYSHNLGEDRKQVIVIRHPPDDTLDIHERSPF